MTQEVEHRQSAFLDLIGAEVEELGEGYVRIRLRVEERHTNPNGVMHGGVITSLMDEATGAAIVTIRGIDVMQKAPHATIDMSVSFLGGVRPGDDLVFEAEAVRVGRSVAFAEAKARKHGEEKMVAMGRFTYVIYAPRGGS